MNIPDIAELSRRLKQVDNDNFDRFYPIIREHVYDTIFLDIPCFERDSLFEVDAKGVQPQVFRRMETALRDDLCKKGYIVERLEILSFFSCVSVIHRIKIPSPPKFRPRWWWC